MLAVVVFSLVTPAVLAQKGGVKEEAVPLVTDQLKLPLSNLFGPPGTFQLTEAGDVYFNAGSFALFHWSGGVRSRLLQGSDPHPGLPGSVNDAVGGGLTRNAVGHVAMLNNFFQKNVRNPRGIFVYDGVNFTKVVMRDEEAPGTGGKVFSQFGGFLINNSDQVASTAAIPQIRTDGVYYLIRGNSKNAEGIPECAGVRFYDDHTVVEFKFFGQPADLLKWFNLDREDLMPGRWTINGNELVVVVGRGFEESTRTGTLTPEGWRMTEKVTFEGGWRITEMNALLQFAQLPFPREPARTAKNRRPYFTGTGKQTRYFDYDRAGNLLGITQEMEVQASDPDGDPLEFAWKASNGTIGAEGPKAVWKREMKNGQPLPGNVSVEVSDGKGGKVTVSRVMK